MFGDASLRVLPSRRVEIPLGNYCDFLLHWNGWHLSKYKAVSIENFVQLLKS